MSNQPRKGPTRGEKAAGIFSGLTFVACFTGGSWIANQTHETAILLPVIVLTFLSLMMTLFMVTKDYEPSRDEPYQGHDL
jgi:hypothetical protein